MISLGMQIVVNTVIEGSAEYYWLRMTENRVTGLRTDYPNNNYSSLLHRRTLLLRISKQVSRLVNDIFMTWLNPKTNRRVKT